MAEKKGLFSKGFIISLVILIVISFILGVYYYDTQRVLKRSICKTNKWNINSQAILYKIEKKHWPKNDLSDIGNDKNYFPNGLPTCPFDNSNYQMEEKSHRVMNHDH